MTGPEINVLGAASHGLAALLYSAFAVFVLYRMRRVPVRGEALAFLLATLSTAVWATFATAALWTRGDLVLLAAGIFDSVRYGAWYAFLIMLLQPWSAPAGVRSRRQLLLLSAATVVLVAAFSQVPIAGLIGLPGSVDRIPAFAMLAMPILGMFLIEQFFRSVRVDSRWNAKPLCLGLGGLCLYDFYAFSSAALFNRTDPDIAPIRGIVHALFLPLLFLAVTRSSDWISKLRVSRKVALHSVSLLAAGLYLMLISVIGSYVRYFGGSWGRALQFTILFASMVLLVTMAFSGTMRAKMRVLIGKHFVRYRYDYREEWLSFTNTLSAQSSPEAMGPQVIRGLANMVESPAGVLWLRQAADGRFRPHAAWNFPVIDGEAEDSAPLIAFMSATGWVVDIDEVRSSPEKFSGLILPAWLDALPPVWLIVPLRVGEPLVGFVLLAPPRTPFDVNWEVLDLLKAAGRQAASFLSQMQATEALLEARKFEAFSRMSAFVVHDLKNIVTQLSLMLKNAQRHHDNPEFQRDMMITVQNSLDRMRQLILQLREGEAGSGDKVGVDLRALAQRVLASAVARGRIVDLDVRETVFTRGDPRRLERVVGHLVQNAMDASSIESRVSITVGKAGGSALLSVEDAGHGMSPEFVREQLFKPFQTTKVDGMGIGSFESFQYVQELGGTIKVVSTPKVGTIVTLLLPLLDTRADSDIKMLNIS